MKERNAVMKNFLDNYANRMIREEMYHDDSAEYYTDTYTKDLRSRVCSQPQKRLPVVDYYINLYYICHTSANQRSMSKNLLNTIC